MRPMSARRESGVVLVVVLVFVLLLASTVATFLKRAVVDTMIARNRDSGARAEALARGGIRLGTVLILEDRLREISGDLGIDASSDLWAKVQGIPIPVEEGATLQLHIEDAGDKLNLNAVFQFDPNGDAHENAAPLLDKLLEKVIEEMPIPPDERALYDRAELVANLIDYADPGDLRQRGGPEDDAYQDRDPPQRPANRPLLSLDELRVVEGFDALLVEAMRPYLTVHPFAGLLGINPNTAPPHVLALLFFNDGVEFRLAPEETIRDLLRVRQEGGWICGEGQSDERCTPISEIMPNANAIYPPAAFQSDVFVVSADAVVGDVRRSVEAVLDRRSGGRPLLLSWRVL